MPRRLFPLAFVAIMALAAACQGTATSAPTAAPTTAPTAAPTTAATLAPTAVATASAAASGLSVTGSVATPLALGESDLHAMDVAKVTADKPKNAGSATFQGVRLSVLFQKAGVNAGAQTASFTAADGYVTDVALADITKCADCMVAFGDSPGHLQTVMPGMSGKAWVKDVVKIDLK